MDKDKDLKEIDLEDLLRRETEGNVSGLDPETVNELLTSGKED